MSRVLAACGGVLLGLWISMPAFANGNSCGLDATGTVGLSFGTLDPSNAAVKTTSGSVKVGDCAASRTMAVTYDNGAHFSGGSRNMLRTGGTELIPYTLSAVTITGGSAGPGNGNYKVATFIGTIQPTAYADAVAGVYQDTLIISVTP